MKFCIVFIIKIIVTLKPRTDCGWNRRRTWTKTVRIFFKSDSWISFHKSSNNWILIILVDTLTKKWKTIRDYSVRSKEKKPTGSAASKRDETLSFLNQTSILKRQWVCIAEFSSYFHENLIKITYFQNTNISAATGRRLHQRVSDILEPTSYCVEYKKQEWFYRFSQAVY